MGNRQALFGAAQIAARGVGRQRLPAIVASALLLLYAAFPAPVAAAGFHGYSHAWESSTVYIGMSNTRPDRVVGGLPNDGCAAPYTGTPVYETMWLKYDLGNNFELGTGHQCGDNYRYWFWGISINGGWTPLGEEMISTAFPHTFRMERVYSVSGYVVKYIVDGTTKDTASTDSRNFEILDVGLESYCESCTVSHYTNGTLQYKWGSSWYNWAGRDGSQINDPPMCGHWLSDSSWQSGEEASC